MPVLYFNYDSIREKQIILSLVPNEENESWHYLAEKNYLHY